jgi:spermidine/putrescine transport system ATP-binding protein
MRAALMKVDVNMQNLGADLSLDKIEKNYGKVTALKPLSLDVPAGTFLSVLGPSGSGKTTVLRLIGGFLRPTAGRVRLGGEDITDQPIYQRPCNTVFQDYALFPHLNVAQNVGYGLSVRGRAKAAIDKAVEEILAVVGLETMAGRAPAQLSGGQRQRVALARALICEPRLMLLDEPLAALDAELRRQMQDFLRAQQRRSGITFLFVTHDQQEAISISDLILVMNKGSVDQVATPQELYYRPQTPFVAGFFGDNNVIDGIVNAKSRIVTSFGEFDALNPNGCSAGSAAKLALRPEAIIVKSEKQKPITGQNSVAAVIQDVSFFGAGTRITSRAGDQLITSTSASSRDGSSFAQGQTVQLHWAAEDSILVKA